MSTAFYPGSARLIRSSTYPELPGWGQLFKLFNEVRFLQNARV
jgi:hypothetical protein